MNKKLIPSCLYALGASSIIVLSGCEGTGADDVSFDFDTDAVVSENASNVYVEPPRAPEGFKVIYYVDAGDGTPDSLEDRETFGTRSSTEDQQFGADPVTGHEWGYTSPTAQYFADLDSFGSIRGDERDTAGQGVDYAFEMENGAYTVVVAFNDPWDSGNRHVDIMAEGNALQEGYYISEENEWLRFDDVAVADGQLNLSVARTAINSDSEADPQISWIEIWGDTDEETAAPSAKIWVAGDFQFESWDWSKSPQMTPVGEDWYEITVNFQAAGGLKFLNQNQFSDQAAWGVATEGGDTISFAIDSFPIEVAEAGYYDLRFNISSLEYSVQPTDLSGLAPQENMYVVGSGFSDFPEMDWSPANGIPMTKNFNGMGEHVFGIESLAFSDATQLKIISELSWNGLDIGFVNASVFSESASNFYWAETVSGSGTPNLAYNGAAGLYTLIFDYGAGRATLFKSRMYMVGHGTPGDWGVGQALEMDQGADGWFELPWRFNREAGDNPISPYGDFKFVSEQSWNAGNFGLVDRNVNLLDMVNSDASQGIPVPAPGYYNVRFNPSELMYEINPLDPIDERTEMFAVGKGFVDYPELNWNPAMAFALEANFNGEGDYVFGKACVAFSEAVDLKFIGAQNWDDLNVGFVSGGEQIAPLYQVRTVAGSSSADVKIVDQAGHYDISFDYFINRASVVPSEGDCN